MKVLELIESAAAGVGRHVVDLTAGLLARGHQVHLLYSELRSDQTFVSDLQRLKKHSYFHALQVSMRQWPSRSDIHAIRVLRKYMCAHGPFDLVHCHSTKAGLIGRAGLVGHPVKRLYTPHMFFTMGTTGAPPIRWAVAMLEASLSRLCHGVIAVSREERSHAVELGIAPAKICMIPNGVPLDQLRLPSAGRDAIRRAWGLDPAEVCIGFVGRLTIQKSPQTLLRSFATFLRSATVPARLVVIGDGPLEGSLRRLAGELNIDARVTWLGGCDARPLMGAFDVFALTSESEGHPLVVLEAMARGLPVVATAVGGISASVQHGVNGYITPVRGMSEIAAALGSLVNDPALRKRMGQASLTRSQNFSVDRMVEQTVALYEQIISGAQPVNATADLKVAALR